MQTQYQWRFEAVEESLMFPLGCKTTHKAYSSDLVVEIEQKPKNLCIMPIGMSIGLEAHKVYNTWQPEAHGANSIAGRVGTEGYYLIKKVPNKIWKPLELIEGSSEILKKTIKEIRKEYHGTSVLEEWISWYKNLAPENDNVQNYLVKLKITGRERRSSIGQFMIPLNLLNNPSKIVNNSSWTLSNGFQVINPDFEYPAVLQAAMNSVVSEFNTRPHQPRLTAETDRDLLSVIEIFEDKAKPLYDNVKAFAMHKIRELIQRLVSFDGLRPAVGGNKTDLVKRITKWGIGFIVAVFRDLGQAQSNLVHMHLNYMPNSHEESISISCKVGDVTISKGALRSLKEGLLN